MTGRMSGTFYIRGAWDRRKHAERRGLVRRFESWVVYHVLEYTTFSWCIGLFLVFQRYKNFPHRTYPILQATQEPHILHTISFPTSSQQPSPFPQIPITQSTYHRHTPSATPCPHHHIQQSPPQPLSLHPTPPHNHPHPLISLPSENLPSKPAYSIRR